MTREPNAAFFSCWQYSRLAFAKYVLPHFLVEFASGFI